MHDLTTLTTNLLKNEDGATALEYGLIAGLISVVIVASLQALGPKLKAAFDAIAAALP